MLLACSGFFFQTNKFHFMHSPTVESVETNNVNYIVYYALKLKKYNKNLHKDKLIFFQRKRIII